LKKIDSSEFDLTKDNVYRKVLDQLNVEDKDILFILCLVKEIDEEKDEIKKSSYRSRISKVLEDFDTEIIGKRTQKLLKFYAKLKKIDVRDYKNLFLEFTKKYCSVQKFAYQIFNDYEKAEEFRRTLSILIARGKLNLPLIKSKINKKIDSLLKERQVSRGFIILMNRYQRLKKVQESLNKFPQIEIGRLKPHNFPSPTQYLHMRIVYPKFYYSSAKEFMEKEILSKIPEKEKDNGFVAVLPLEIMDVTSYPRSQSEIKNDKMKVSFQAINYLRTGLHKDITEIITEYTISEINISEILSIIPFNIFVPRLKREAKDFLIENYEYLQSHFKINSLFDWSEINPKDLAEKIISMDKNKILSKKEWYNVCNKICKEAEKHIKAIQ
jgi:hypothetical protein